MAITEEVIDAIESAAEILRKSGEPVIAGLRKQFPEVVFVRCDAADMDAPPYRSGSHYQLYLFDRSEICIRLTDQTDTADGVIVAELD